MIWAMGHIGLLPYPDYGSASACPKYLPMLDRDPLESRDSSGCLLYRPQIHRAP